MTLNSLVNGKGGLLENLGTSPNFDTNSDTVPAHRDSTYRRMDTREMRVTKEWLKRNSGGSALLKSLDQKHMSIINQNHDSQDKTFMEIEEERGQRTRCIIRSSSVFKLRWDLFIMILAIYNCIVTPVNVSFNPGFMQSVAFFVFNTLIDVIFFLDIVVSFRTSFIHFKTGDEVTSPKQIAVQYIQGRFWIDLIASVPFDTFGLLLFQNNSTELQLFGILKLVRVLRLGRIITYMNARDDIKLSLKLMKLIFFLILYLHCFG